MLRATRAVLILLLIALVPMRAVAAVTQDACNSAGDSSEQARQHAEQSGDHDERGSHDDAPRDSGHGCGYCVTHCAGMALAMAEEPARLVLAGATDRTPFGVWLALGFCPDLLDRPPLFS